MKSLKEEIRVYAIVLFTQKESAKKLRAKWDKDRKSWYFVFDMDDFLNYESCSTETFRPTEVRYDDEFKKMDNITFAKIHNIAMNRYLENLKNGSKPKPKVENINSQRTYFLIEDE